MSQEKIKYLEMIQAVVNRMAQNSFALKGWAVTLVTGLSAFSAVDKNKWLILVALIPIILFWFLDSYYLQQERKYRALYNKAVADKSEKDLFNLKPPKANKADKTLFRQSLFSPTEAGMYIPFLAVVGGVLLIICFLPIPVTVQVP